MSKLSLKARSFVAALLALFLFIPLCALALERAFVGSLTQALMEQLQLHSLTLISEFEFDQGDASMPTHLHNDKLNMPESGLYALISSDSEILWQSESALSLASIPALPSLTTGSERFNRISHGQSDFFVYTFVAEFENQQDFTPVSFHLLQDAVMFDLELSQYRNTLWYWLGLISLVLITLLLFSIHTALKPIGQLIRQLKQIEQGQAQQLQAEYPQELEQLKNNINHLLETELKQRQRYKNSLSDLAHSLKTPLAVLSGQHDLPEQAQAPLQQIRVTIERQLKRASADAQGAWLNRQPLRPLLEQLIGAMQKVYADKNLRISLDCPAHAVLKADKTDILELFGNLLDNACKAAKQQVLVHVEQSQQLCIRIEDDGPGIPPAQREQLLERGKRLDSYAEGQGIGLAIASDLLSAYQGSLSIQRSALGGACFEVRFDNITAN